MVYGLELFETCLDCIYSFLPIITLDIYIHNLHDNLRRTRRTPIMLSISNSRSMIRINVMCHHTHLDSIVICH
jgi:hypothetical protein